MKLIHLISLFFRDLLRNRFFLIFFIVNLSISITGLIGLENFKSAFNYSIQSRAKNIAGSDLSISGRNLLSENKLAEINNLLEPIKFCRLVSFFSMAKGSDRSKLIRVTEFKEEFPFYGEIVYSPAINKLQSSETIVYPSVLKIFNLTIGSYLKIGGRAYKIVSVVLSDSSETFDMGQIAPKVFLSSSAIEEGNFLTTGSTAFYSTFFQTKNSINENLKNKILDIVDDTSIQVRTQDDISGQVGRVLQYLNDFLGIISIVALFLSLVGAFYLYLSFLIKKRKTISIYKTLGLSLKKIKQGLYFQCFFIGIISISCSILMSLFLNEIGNKLISPYLTNPLKIGLSFSGILVAFFVFLSIVIFLMRPIINFTLNEKASDLFQEVQPSHIHSNINVIAIFGMIIPILFLMAFLMTSSWKLSFGFILSLLLGLGLINFVFYLFYRYFPSMKKLEFKLALKYIKRQRLSSISIFISIFFGISLLSLIPVIEKNINSQLTGIDEKGIPEYFLFDIQEEQIKDLETITKDTSSELISLSPLIRARLIKINNELLTVTKEKAITREQQRAQQFQNRGVNLSYRKELNIGEEVIEGSLQPYNGEGVIPLSLEQRYMERIGVKLGDHLTFDILGLDFEGIITSVRQVRWTSFLPNFFILFPPGVLEDTPKTFLASLKIKQDDQTFVDLISEKLPNVSMVDIRDITKKIILVMNEMSKALVLMSVLSIFVGLMIVISLMNHQLIERKKDILLFHLIGLDLKRIKKSIFIEFLSLTIISALFGSLFGQILGQYISYKIFYSLGNFDFLSTLKILFFLFLSLFTMIKITLRKI